MTQQQWDPEKEYKVERWPASLALLACAVLYASLPEALVIKPKWLVPVLILLPLIPLTISTRSKSQHQRRWIRPVTIGTIAVINIANIVSMALLIHRQFWHHTAVAQNGRTLFFSGILIWVTNVLVFGLWFWELDRGGPSVRGTKNERWPDFQFPQMATPEMTKPDWHPRLYDYLYVGFTNASAFSPTDAMPLTVLAKALMTLESGVSMLTIVVVVARAINILG